MFWTILQAICVAAFVLYPLAVLVRDRSGASLALFAACWVTGLLALADMLAMTYPESYLRWKWLAMLAEGLLCPAWLVFSMTYARRLEWGGVSSLNRLLVLLSLVPPALAAFFPTSAFFYSPDFGVERVLFLEPLAFFFYLQIMLFLAVAMFNLEATLANAVHGVKWKVKFAIVGMGTLLASHVLYFSQSLLYRSLDMEFVPVRTAGAFVGLLLLVYSRTNRGTTGHIAISRNLAYKSVVLLVAGVYLVVLGVLGEGMKHFGEGVSRNVVVGLTFAGALAVVIAGMSETVRRKVRVMLQRYFYKENYDYRIQWREFTERLATAESRDDLLRRVLIGYCETFGIVGAALFLADNGSGDLRPAMFLEMDDSDIRFQRGDPFGGLMLGRSSVLDMRRGGLNLRPETREYLEEAGVTFVVPVRSGERLEGIILLGPLINESEEYGPEDFELMEALSRQVGAVAANLRLGDELAEAREMEMVGKVATFVMHDLKNLVYPLSLTVENAREYINDPEFQKDMLESLTNITSRMKILISQLTHLPSDRTMKRESVDLMELARETAGLVNGAEVDFRGEGVTVFGDRDELQKVVLNLFLNALDASSGAPFEVFVGDDGAPFFRVSDRGTGVDEELLRGGLFQPFRSTKKKGMGIGLYQCKQIVEAHGGRIDVTSAPGEGASFKVAFPERNASPQADSSR